MVPGRAAMEQNHNPGRRGCGATASWAYAIAYGFIYAGFLCHRSARPAVYAYTWAYTLFLVALVALFFLPAAVRAYLRRFGARSLALPCGLVAVLYLGFAWRYYATQTHRFDPFLQMPAPRFAASRGVPDARTLRVLMLGGSTTRGGALAAGERYPDVLGARLGARYPGVSVEVLNGGMDWYTTRHSLFNYVGYGRDFHPDLVVVMHGINDLYRSFSPPGLALGAYDEQWAHFYGPSINGADPPSFLGHLLSRPLADWYSEARLVERDLPLERYLARAAYERNLRALVHYIRADGAQAVLLTEPYLYKPEPSRAERDVLVMGRELCRTQLGRWRQEYPSPASLGRAMAAFDDVTRRVAAEEGAMLVDAESRLPKDLDHFADDVHYTTAGARAMGEIVAGELIASGVVQDRLSRNRP